MMEKLGKIEDSLANKVLLMENDGKRWCNPQKMMEKCRVPQKKRCCRHGKTDGLASKNCDLIRINDGLICLTRKNCGSTSNNGDF